MKKILTAGIALLALAGCAADKAPVAATPAKPAQPAAQAPAPAEGAATVNGQVQVAKTDSIDKTVEAFYTCQSPMGSQKVSVMYGVKDGTLVVAQLKLKDKPTPGLWRVLNDVNGDTQNSYYGEGLTWITDKASPANVKTVDGIMLTQAKQLDVNGVPTGVQDILLKTCTAEKAAAAKKAPAKKK